MRGGKIIKKIEIDELNIELNDNIYNRLNILRAERSVKYGEDIEWNKFFNLLFKLGRKNKSINEIKKEISIKRQRELSWDEFFEIKLKKIRNIKSIIGWLYTVFIFLIITFVLILPWYVLGLATDLLFIMPIFVIIGLFAALFSAYILTPFSLRIYKPFTEAPKELFDIINDLSKKLNIKRKTELVVAETPEINAMTWSGIFSHKICLTRGLAEAYRNEEISKEEIKAIIGHEFGHIKNNDNLRMSFVLSWISIFSMIGNLLIIVGTSITSGIAAARNKPRKDEEELVGLAVIILGWISVIIGFIMKIMAKISSIFAFHLIRKDEYDADRIGAELTQTDAMGQSLKRIDFLNNKLIEKELESLPYADRWQITPKNLSWIDRLYSTHPPMSNRVDKLNQVSKFS